ncbi:nucleotide exchange factor GrpE [Candidatus Carsonella ruddii]|uniref:Nucleotide exchange factor GrpE n=1 Tax=Carsonella ruddii TaxID=114186 RepID=A0A2K8K9H0_CARRU|nr:nucleotide exchange factor GrpE [Candidatus Carsonella ruddii]ATX33503.1 nucleotide exchange factor GrpE [Candidatus Carsonella ruddii]
MEKEFSLLNFLERVTILEEKFFFFITNAKKIYKHNLEEFNNLKESLINNILSELIPITDTLEMFSKNFTSNQNNEIEILVLIFKLIKKFFLKFNIKQISKIGILFNPEIHEAIGIYPTESNKKGIIKSILQTGYTKNGILIRPALVVIYN